MILKLRILLKGLNQPTVWRQVLVPAEFSLDRLHRVIQHAFGWSDYHLYSFAPNGLLSRPSFEYPSKEADYQSVSSRTTKVAAIFEQEGDQFTYTYDFGDNWEHLITVEEVFDEKTATSATLLSGRGKCPPEDCGGVSGYQNFLKVLRNPMDPDYDSMRTWAGLSYGEQWDSEEFNLEQTAKLVKTLPRTVD